MYNSNILDIFWYLYTIILRSLTTHKGHMHVTTITVRIWQNTGNWQPSWKYANELFIL